MDYHKAEKAKYEMRWENNYRSSSANPFALYLLKYGLKGSCLEIGCGDGFTADVLTRNGVNVTGVDITLKGIKYRSFAAYEAPAWEMPFDDKAFDYTFSTDLLEHIPTEMVEATIAEIIRVTKVQTIHHIATFQMWGDHLTVKEIQWWGERFAEAGSEIDVLLLERKLTQMLIKKK